jgi:F0F1-type ATP synthase assembly protein I
MEESPEYIIDPKVNKKQTLFILIKFGVGAALVGMLFDQLAYAFPSANFLFSFLGSLAPVLACTIGLVYYKQFNSNLKFGKIFWFCLRMGFVVSAMQSIFLYLNLKFFNRGMLEALRKFKKEELIAFNQQFNWISREDLLQQTEPGYFNTYVCGPGVEATGSFFWSMVFFMVIGLFIAVFNRNRKSKNPFQQA